MRRSFSDSSGRCTFGRDAATNWTGPGGPWPTARAHADAVRLRVDAEVTQERSRRQAQDARVRLATLEATAGVEHQAVLAEIEGLQAEARLKKEEQKRLQESRLELGRRIGTLQNSLARAEQDRIDAFVQRDAAHQRFTAANADGLFSEAELEWEGALDGVTAVLAAAREVATVLSDAASDEASRQKASSQVDDRLYEARAVLSGHADLARDLGDHDWWILRASVHGVRRPVRELRATLQRDLDEGRADLAAEEERLFEQTLAGSIRRSLANRIRQANRLVDGINEQLGRIRTAAAGVGVRLSWRSDPEQSAAVRSARSLLLKDRVTDEERARSRISCGPEWTRLGPSWSSTRRGRRGSASRSITGPGIGSRCRSPTETGKGGSRRHRSDCSVSPPGSVRSPSICPCSRLSPRTTPTRTAGHWNAPA